MSIAKAPRVKQDLPELNLLFDISRILDSSIDMRDVVQPALKALAEHLGFLHGTLTLYDPETQQINIEAAHGLSIEQKKLGSYTPGEGITGKVVQSRKPLVIPRISAEPEFLNRTGAHSDHEQSFICAPILLGNEVVGTLSGARLETPKRELDELVRIVSIVGSMISQAVKLRQEAQSGRKELMEENERLQAKLKNRFRPHNMIGNSQAMQDVYDHIAQVSSSNATVLVLGESGTGKELVAEAIHYNSPRGKKPFIKVNCASLPEAVLESELFGHEKGAFTGAVQQRKGRFELADGGTLFLDEIGELTQDIQVKLLRVMQEREFERVGGMKTLKVDVRIVAATNRNLEEMVAKGEFREDFFYRLNVFPIHLPPLRERKTDALQLANRFVERFSQENSKNVRRISTPAIDMIMAYHWPGNVRELENCIERAVLLTDDDVIHGHHLPATLQTAESSNTVMATTLQATLDNVEREMIVEALKNHRGNMAQASESLGLTERVMGLRVKKHNIDYKRFRT